LSVSPMPWAPILGQRLSKLHPGVFLWSITAQPLRGCAHLCFKPRWAYPRQSFNSNTEVYYSKINIYFRLVQLLMLLASKWAITC
jgi:hypothetical protein